MAYAKSKILRNILIRCKKDMKNQKVFCVFFCMQKEKEEENFNSWDQKIREFLKGECFYEDYL